MGHINRWYFFVPETEPVVAYYHVEGMADNHFFQYDVFPDGMKEEQGYLKKDNDILGQVTRIYRPESREAETACSGKFVSDEGEMFFSGSEYDVPVGMLQFFCQRDHSARMSETPFQGTDKDIFFLFQYQPETWVFIPRLFTIRAMRFISPGGTLRRSLPLGVSL